MLFPDGTHLPQTANVNGSGQLKSRVEWVLMCAAQNLHLPSPISGMRHSYLCCLVHWLLLAHFWVSLGIVFGQREPSVPGLWRLLRGKMHPVAGWCWDIRAAVLLSQFGIFLKIIPQFQKSPWDQLGALFQLYHCISFCLILSHPQMDSLRYSPINLLYANLYLKICFQEILPKTSFSDNTSIIVGYPIPILLFLYLYLEL